MKKLILEIGMALAVSILLGMIFDLASGVDNKKPVMRMITTSDAFILQELGAVILLAENELKVDMVAPENGRPTEYRAVDLKKDDIILMLNGKKVTTPKELRDGYDALAVGADVKLGVRRDRQMMIVSMAKIDPAKLPKRDMVMSFETADGPVKTDSLEVISLDGVQGKIVPLTDLGIILKTDVDRVVIAHVLPNAKEVFDAALLEVGDQILELNGTKVVSLDDFEIRYSKLATGSVVGLVLKRGDKPVKVEVKKPQGDAEPMIINKKVTQ